MLHVENADRVFIGGFEANAIVADAQSEIRRALQTLYIPDAGIRVVRQRAKDFHRLFAIDPPQIGSRLILPMKASPQETLA